MSSSVSLSCSWCSLCAVSDVVFAVSTLVRSTRRRRAWPCPPDRLALAGSDRSPPRRMARRRARWRGRQLKRGRLPAHPRRPCSADRSRTEYRAARRCTQRPGSMPCLCADRDPTSFRARAGSRCAERRSPTPHVLSSDGRAHHAGALPELRAGRRGASRRWGARRRRRGARPAAGPPEPSGWPLCTWAITAGVR